MSTEKPGLVLPRDEYELVRRIVDRLHLQIEDAQETDWQARAEAAEAKLAAISKHCQGPIDWYRTLGRGDPHSAGKFMMAVEITDLAGGALSSDA